MGKLSIQIDPQGDQPKYWQVYWQIRQQILHGDLPPGAKLLASRRLAKQVGVARVTVLEALAQLQAEGFIVSRPGAGTFVAEALPETAVSEASVSFSPTFSAWGRRVLAAPTRPAPAPLRNENREGGETAVSGEIDFGLGRTYSHSFPYDIWRRLLARYLSTDDIILARYGSVAGFMPLREAIAHHLAHMRGVRCTPEQVVIVSGAQQTLDILTRLLLSPGSGVLVETPGYQDAFQLFRVNGARLVALPVDEAGFPVENIPPDTTARMLFVTPSNQFPRGGTMPLARRLALLQWAQIHDALIIEDDYDGELRYDGRPLAALQGLDEEGRVVYLGTFSKVLFPALRLAYVVLPPSLVRPFVHAKRLIDRGAPTLTQAAVADFIREGHFDRHLRHLRQAYGARRQTLVDALDRFLPEQVRYAQDAAGLHVMVYLDEVCDEAALVREAAAKGVRVYPGAPYHLQRPFPASILLGFSGLDETAIAEGVRRLATVLPC